MKSGSGQYNEAVRVVQSKQMLKNLVRLRYREIPVFLSISSVSTQFEFNQTGQVGGTINENVGPGGLNPNLLNLSGSQKYSERPTITYSILGGEDFVKRLLTPISVEHISLLSETGWRPDRVLRLTVERANGLSNAPAASGPTPSLVPPFRRFKETTQLLHELLYEHAVELEFSVRTMAISPAIPISQVNGGALVEAARRGAAFEPAPDGEGVVLTKERRVLVLRFNPEDRASHKIQRLRELLHLTPNRDEFELVGFENRRLDPLVSQQPCKNIAIDTRSLIAVLYYASQAVQVPPEDEASGIVTTTRDAHGNRFDWAQVLGDLFTVHVSESRPADAVVAIRHRGHWFYIRDDDETSKSTFLLLNQLFALQSGEVETTRPLLTLPVGG